MDNLGVEIMRFITTSKFSESTKIKYDRHLKVFVGYLSLVTNTNIDNLHIEKIYKVHSQSGMFLFYRPITPELLDGYFLDNIEKGFSWLESSMSAISSFMKYLERRYDFPNPIREIKFKPKVYKKQKRPQRVLSRHEILLFLESIIKYSDNLARDILLFSILISTGCRISEILNLTVDKIDWTDDALFLTKTKNKKARTVVLRNSFGQFLQEYARLNNLSGSDFLFCSTDNKGISRNEVQKLLSSYLYYSGLESINIHGLRHSFATLMFESGSELLVIQQLLGHSILASTKTYVHPNYVRNYGIVIKENQEVYKKAKEFLHF